MTDTPNPVESDGNRPQPRPKWDCSMMRRFPGKERNMARELAEHFKRADASAERRANKTGHQAPATSQDARRQNEVEDGVTESKEQA